MKRVLSAIAVAGLVMTGTLSAEMLPQTKGRAQVLRPVKMDVSPALRDIPVPPLKPFDAREIPNRTTPLRPAEPGTSEKVQTTPGLPNTPDPLAGWVGLGSDDNQAIIGGRLMPPDTQGEIGKDHYIQWINLVFAIWDKAGNKVYPPQPGPVGAAGNVLWSGFGGRCETDNSGDPITLWDPLAERWVMSQFAVGSTPFTQCVAVSTTSDPTGTWYRYAYAWPNSRFPDYPKLGVWTDGYYITTNDFNSSLTSFVGVTVGAFERDKMLVGDPAGFIYFQTSGDREYSVLPADLDGTTPPPAGTPGLIGEFQDSSWIGTTNDQVWLFELNLDWTNPANSTFGVGATHDPNWAIDISNVSANCSGRDCVPQGSSSQKVDDIDFRLMHRLAYTNLGSSQALVASMTVGAGGRAGVWWGELQSPNPGPTWTLRQDGVYAPADGDHRWMPAIAMDINGNIMLGYSASSTTVYPSVRYVGRLAGDPLGQMGDEKVLVVGSGAQSGGNRWGDYSMMSVDPVDGCTFWYTQEYIAASGNFDWDTYIGSMKFPSCTAGPAGVIEGYVRSTADNSPIAGASVQIGGAYSTTTNASGFYQLTVPVGTYDVTASKFGYGPASVAAQEVTEGATTVVADLLLSPVGSYAVDGFVTAEVHNWPLWAKVEVRQSGTLVETVYTSPWNGYYEIPALPNGYSYDFTVTSMYAGYQPETRVVAIASGDQIQSFSLLAASGNPAYACFLNGGLNEDFEGDFPPLGWTVLNNTANTNNVWKRNDTWGRENLSGGTGYCADADSDKAGSGSGTFDTELRSPLVQMPATPRVLKFHHYFNHLTTDSATVDVSTNGGGSWTNLASWTTADVAGEATIDLSAYVSQTIMLRWRFTSASYQWYWMVDDIRTETPTTPPAYIESFDGTTFPPTGWTRINADGGGSQWLRTTTLPYVHTGAGSAYHNYSSAAVQDGWLVSPALAIPPGGAALSFFEWTRNPASYNKHSLWACTADCAAPPTNFTEIAEFGSPVAGWRRQDVSLTPYAGGNVTLAFRYQGNASTTAAYWYIDDVQVPTAFPVVDTPTLSCEALPGTMVAGYVTDANTAAGVVGAEVLSDLGTVTTTAAATANVGAGFYYMYSPIASVLAPNGPSTRTFTASKTGYGSVAHSVNLTPDTVNRLDFALPAASLSLGGWPFVIDGRLTPDGQPVSEKTQAFSILNSGGLPSEVKLGLKALPMTFPHQWPTFVSERPATPRNPAVERAPKGSKATSSARRYPGLAGSLAGVPAYGVELLVDAFGKWEDASIPAAFTVIASHSGTAYYASDFLNGDFSLLYALDRTSNTFRTLDTTTGAVTVIGPAAPLDTADIWTAMAGSPDGSLYATDSGGNLYTIDTATGAPTRIGLITNGGVPIALAANSAGELYAVDINGDNLVKIDPATAAGTIVGSVGIDASYAQGMDFDEETDTLYWASYNVSSGSGVPELRTIDTATGASFLIGAFASGTEFDSFAIATGGLTGLPWITLTPAEGTVPAAGQLDVMAEFFPEGVNASHYGLFRAVVKPRNDTPNPLPEIPVYFTKAFWDVPVGYWADAHIHALAGMRITRGCGGGNYCPSNTLNRAEMAVTMVRAMYGPDYAPPPAVGIFADVEISDASTTADYIEQLYNDGVVNGCGTAPMRYCPNDLVNRAAMSKYLVNGFSIPLEPVTGYFTDVTGTIWDAFAPYAEALFREGITLGCGGTNFCPADTITRDQLAVFLVRALGLPMYTHPVAP